MLTSEGSKNRSTHIIEVNGKQRTLTPIECERLNGFPDDWTKGMSDRMRYFCMGNALVVGLIRIMGEQIEKIEQRDRKSTRLNSSHVAISYAVFCLKKKKIKKTKTIYKIRASS